MPNRSSTIIRRCIVLLTGQKVESFKIRGILEEACHAHLRDLKIKLHDFVTNCWNGRVTTAVNTLSVRTDDVSSYRSPNDRCLGRTANGQRNEQIPSHSGIGGEIPLERETAK